MTVRTRAHALRDVLDAIFYVLRSGCPWRLLPGDFPPWQTVFYHFRKFRVTGLWHRLLKTLRAAERVRLGKDPDASAAILDSQSVKTVEELARTSGYDAGKSVKGRKRHLLVDTLADRPIKSWTHGCRNADGNSAHRAGYSSACRWLTPARPARRPQSHSRIVPVRVHQAGWLSPTQPSASTLPPCPPAPGSPTRSSDAPCRR